MDCHYCGDEIVFGVIQRGYAICSACDRELSHPPQDTPSLRDRDPEGYGYITNTNPWGMEGGY